MIMFNVPQDLMLISSIKKPARRGLVYMPTIIFLNNICYIFRVYFDIIILKMTFQRMPGKVILEEDTCKPCNLNS